MTPTEFWNPATEVIVTGGSLAIGRRGNTTILLDDRRLFAIGGFWLASFELW